MSKDMLGPLVRASVNLSQPQINLSRDVMNRFTGKEGVAWEAHIKSVLRSGLPSQPRPLVLKLISKRVRIDAIKSYDPSGFKSRPGLFVSDDFQARVGSIAKPVKNLSAIKLSSFDLTVDASDKEIKSELPANHVFKDESEFVAYLDQMISKQSNGETGDLLNNCFSNLFYVVNCVVAVYWDVSDLRWEVHTWRLSTRRWNAGRCVFSPN